MVLLAAVSDVYVLLIVVIICYNCYLFLGRVRTDSIQSGKQNCV